MDAVLDAGDKLDFVDISLITEATSTAKSTLVSDTFTPQLDSTSVSTFGTSPSASPTKTPALKPSQSVDTNTTMSDVTVESRVSKIEEDFGEVKNMLQILIARQSSAGIPTQSTTPSSAHLAGSSHDGAAPEV